MKRLLMSAIAASALTAAAVPALAQSWLPINQRQAQLDTRINQGIRAGTLTQNEAIRLRTEFRGIVNMEARYRASNGLSAGERADLDRRLNTLSARITINKTDTDYIRNWRTINQRQEWAQISTVEKLEAALGAARRCLRVAGSRVRQAG